MLTVLLTDGAFTGLIRTLRSAYPDQVRIVGLSTNPDTPHQAILDAFYVVPSHEDAEYVDVLIEILKAENVDIIFPIISEGLESLLRNEARISRETGARMISSPLSVLAAANDKGQLYSFLRNHPDKDLSALVPEYFEADTKRSLLDAIQTMLASGKTSCMKRRRGEDAEGFWIIDDRTDYAALLFSEAPRRILSQKMLADMLSKIGYDDPIPPYLVCEYLPGEEWDCDVLCKDGTLVSVTTRINLSMTGGLTAVAEVRDHPYLASCCEKIVAALQLSYVACISFRADADGRLFLLEINPRMMGNIFVSALAGNNYVKMAIDLLNGIEIHPVPPKNGIRTVLYYDQLAIDPTMRHEKNGGTYA